MMTMVVDGADIWAWEGEIEDEGEMRKTKDTIQR